MLRKQGQARCGFAALGFIWALRHPSCVCARHRTSERDVQLLKVSPISSRTAPQPVSHQHSALSCAAQREAGEREKANGLLRKDIRVRNASNSWDLLGDLRVAIVTPGRTTAQEREESVSDKERRMAELKAKNKELEKFKFVLDYKLRELKYQRVWMSITSALPTGVSGL